MTFPIPTDTYFYKQWHLFNNGQNSGGTTAPMGWSFNVTPTSTNYRTNSNLTSSNKPSSLS